MYPNENRDAPITIFMNGGPGSSSIFANWIMNGPMRIKRTGDGDDDYFVYLAE
jgi:carboxypeptidase C (cathepsin A)